MRKQQAGFTLIELVMVIVILGILAATAIPKFTNLQTQAESAAQDGGLGALKSAAAIYYAENKAWPNGTALAAQMTETTTCTTGVLDIDGITKTFTLYDANTGGTALGDCTTAIVGPGAIRKTP